ncbi:hypothetical protein ACFQFQ_21565 [Sulfitobacter porphyrae]|uniref:Uncharacterized protein n=1 Tax=Sulfitobacter porphyrae TaxID=1246864 RepID=A0ABW2B6R8_9RHOB
MAKRYRALIAQGNRSTVAIAAVARELGFMGSLTDGGEIVR